MLYLYSPRTWPAGRFALRMGAVTALCFVGLGADCGDKLAGTTPIEPVAVAPKESLTITSAVSSLPADGASIATITVQSRQGLSGPVTLATTAGSFGANGGSTTVTLVDGHGVALLRAPFTIGDSTAVLTAAGNGTISSAKIGLQWAYPKQITITADAFTISDTTAKRTIAVTALHPPGVATRGTRVEFSARSTDSATGPLVGTFDGPLLTDSVGSVNVHYSLQGDHGHHTGSITISATVYDSTTKQLSSSAVLQLQVPTSPLPGAPSILLARTTALFRAIADSAGTPALDSIGISNGGTGTLSGVSLGTTIYDAGAADWLRANIVGMSTTAGGSGFVTLAATADGITTPGRYTATVPVNAKSPGTTNSPVNIVVTLIVR